MLNIGGPRNKEEVKPFLENFFSDNTVIRIPFGLGKYIGRLRSSVNIYLLIK